MLKIGYEQANKYAMHTSDGRIVGYILEREGLGRSIARQFLHLHRKMEADLMNTEGKVLLKASLYCSVYLSY